MVRAFVILAACCATAWAQGPPAAMPKQCGKPQVSAQPDNLWEPGSRIVGGKTAIPDTWPWIGALLQAKPGYWPYQFCGGTLIADQWFVTAGHCVDSLSEEEIINNVQLVLGVPDLTKATAKDKYRFSKVIKHAQYDQPEGSTNNDIALLKLTKKVTFTSKIQPACLASRPVNDTSAAVHFDKQAGNRKVAFVAGWGHTSEGQQRPYDGDGSKAPPLGAGSDVLQQVNIALYPMDECKRRLRGYVFTEKMCCGGFDQGGKDSCQGDSGGPLIAKTKQNLWELIGVVSWGAGCARAAMPGIYADVYALKQWIFDNIRNN